MRKRRAVLAMGVARIGRRIAGARRRARSVSTAARWRSRVRGFVASTARSRPFPTGKGLLLAVEATKPRTRDLHLAAVETDLALRLAPAMRRPILATPMARTARRLRIDLHHLAKRLKPSRQAKPLEARRHARQRFDLQLSRGNRSGCDKSVHGVAFLSWNQHPEPTGSRRATPLLLFQQ